MTKHRWFVYHKHVDHANATDMQVLDVFLLQLAAAAALTAEQQGRLTTRSLHAELLYNLSGSKHVRALMFILTDHKQLSYW